MTPSQLVSNAQCIAIKVGSSLLTGDRTAWMGSLAADIAALRAEGKTVLLVSSGAVALGRQRLGLRGSPRLAAKQAAAATGQPLLMAAWNAAFAAHGLTAAQLLLTIGDTEARRRWLNARATIETLLGLGVVPVVNENDSVATEELRYGDNDRLSARVAQLAGADVLVLLSDVDGFYERDPVADPSAALIDRLEAIGTDELAAAGGAGTAVGTGGMRTKLEAARIAQGFGCATLIASGVHDHPLARLRADGARATLVPARGSPASAYKQWIAGTLAPLGQLGIDRGAADALGRGSSLLPSGVRSIEGEFVPGDCVRILCDGRELGRGLARYGAREASVIAGLRATDIAGRLGYSRGDELIHRDDLVLT
ncbi:glutamate 5-kinase [Sphingomonas sp. ASV193]|uniref:glutamate 5-kinase n=1 Tax=Sphingomonas sp. ASV193 TaxID=3144405 RepID=UPI0032E8FF0D